MSEEAAEAAALVLEQLGEEFVESQQSLPDDQQAEETELDEEGEEEEGDEEEYEDDPLEEDEVQKDQALTKGPQIMKRGV